MCGPCSDCNNLVARVERVELVVAADGEMMMMAAAVIADTLTTTAMSRDSAPAGAGA